METIMETPYLQTSTQNYTKSSKRTNYPLIAVKQELPSTLYRKVAPKNEIILSRTQLREATWLFTQYDMPKPGWLRTRFVINQRRRKLLNEVLWEASLDNCWCGPHCANNDWSGQLHKLWHLVNSRPLCS
jgi:hypothetical protein